MKAAIEEKKKKRRKKDYLSTKVCGVTFEAFCFAAPAQLLYSHFLSCNMVIYLKTSLTLAPITIHLALTHLVSIFNIQIYIRS